MDNTLMTIIGIFLAVLLIVVLPLVSITERNDDIAQTVAQTATSDFLDTISNAGAIRPSDYEAYLQKLATTGNTFDVEIEVQHLDDNIGKKNGTTSVDLIGENERYSTFTTEILENMYSNKDTPESYILSKGDNVVVTAKNNNKTMAQTLRTFIYKITGQGTYQIGASSSRMVVNDGQGKIEYGTSVPEIRYLYKDGNEYKSITGGWYPFVNSDWKFDTGNYTGAYYSKIGNRLTVGDNSDVAWGNGAFSTYNKINDIENYNKLVIKFTVTESIVSTSENRFYVVLTKNRPDLITYKENSKKDYDYIYSDGTTGQTTFLELVDRFGWTGATSNTAKTPINQTNHIVTLDTLKVNVDKAYKKLDFVVWNSSKDEANKEYVEVIDLNEATEGKLDSNGNIIEITKTVKDEIRENEGCYIVLWSFSHGYTPAILMVEINEVYLCK